MNTPRHLLPALIAACLLAACQPQGESQITDEQAVVVEDTAAPESGVAEPAVEAETSSTASSFDIHSVPVSTVSLGAFPYITLAQGCAFNATAPAHAKAPFWTGREVHWVEGSTLASYISAASGADCGFANVVANMDAVVQQAQGTKLNESSLTREAYKVIQAYGALSRLEEGLQGVQSNPLATWLIRQADRQVWIQIVSDHTGRAYNLLLTEVAAPTITARLLPAAELKQQLDVIGRVALQVNFATDKTDILPESQPQIDQVAELLKIDSALKLAVNGHTDNTGDAAHNQRLSEGRAQSVMAALTGKGIDAARLSAAGHGDSQPVADNGTEQGRAQNRRVELVKR